MAIAGTVYWVFLLHTIPIGFGDVGRRQASEAPLSPWMDCILSNVRNVASSSLQVVGDRGERRLHGSRR
ncbi:hypothetical protein ACH42_06675 [Endozoicomonas sp. (ex Bugula neritina AB1)]|nr:hypothetical protein ACH42_06675 [Endozoicomonas sp. (ex Bugula neritina AB1)]